MREDIDRAFKFASVSPVDSRSSEYRYEDLWDIERTTGPDRLVIAPSSGHVSLLVDLLSVLPEPFGLLYVLLVSRLEQQPGRYQSPYPTDRGETLAFLKEYRGYLENDGRHHLWVMSIPAESTLVYDHHNVIYAYGPLEEFKHVLTVRGLTQGSVRFPVPHGHKYNEEYDGAESAITRYWDWKRFPLQPNDD